MNAEEKLRVLSHIARRLNDEGILWALGASTMLYLNGIAEKFDDLDVMVDTEQAPRAREILRAMGELRSAHPNPQYGTKYFFEFTIEGVDVDVMGGFTIFCDGIEHDCSLKRAQIERTQEICGVPVPLQAVSVWRQYYEWMGRDAKVRMIDARKKK